MYDCWKWSVVESVENWRGLVNCKNLWIFIITTEKCFIKRNIKAAISIQKFSIIHYYNIENSRIFTFQSEFIVSYELVCDKMKISIRKPMADAFMKLRVDVLRVLLKLHYYCLYDCYLFIGNLIQ